MKLLTPLKAIRKYCLGCSGDSKLQVAECNIEDCTLFNFRSGRNPNRKGIGSVVNIETMNSEGNLTMAEH